MQSVDDPPEGEYLPAMYKGEDVTGRLYGEYRVLGRVTIRRYGSGNFVSVWAAECIGCGAPRITTSQRIREGKYGCHKCAAESMQGPKHGNWRGGEHVPGYFVARLRAKVKRRSRELAWEIDAAYLDKLWEQQEGCCAYTGWRLQFGKQGKYAREQTASLDRIDSNYGYVHGNVQFVHKEINLLKWNHSEDRFIQLCKAVADYRKT